VVVGVNKYQVEEKMEHTLFRADPELARQQIESVRALRETRDQDKCERALEGVRKAANGDENLMPRFIEAVKAYATLGEICNVLRDVFGEYQQAETLGKR